MKSKLAKQQKEMKDTKYSKLSLIRGSKKLNN